MPVALSPATAKSKRDAHSKLDALLAKLAAKKLRLERQERRDRGEAVDSSDDDESIDFGDLGSPAASTPGPADAASPPWSPATLTRSRPAASASIYGSKAYWDDRYSDPRATIGASTARGVTNNEWYVGYDVLKPHLLEYAGRNAHCVLLGCGTSTLGEDMAENGFARVAAVDYSEPSIALMRKAQQTRLAKLARSPPERPPPHPFEVDYRVMDVKNMTYPRETFDCVIDKATLDTMCQLDEDPCEAGPPPSSANAVDFRGGQRRRKKNPPSPPPTHAGRMLEEACRVLKPGGRYVCLSYGEPDDRLGMLTSPGLSWGMEAQREIRKGKAGVYFLYVMRKFAPPPPKPRHPELNPDTIVGVGEEFVGVGGSNAPVPVLKDPFHGSKLDLRDRTHDR